MRRVFLAPQEFYTAPEAAALLGWRPRELEMAIRDGSVEATRTCSGYRIEWQEVAAMITVEHAHAEIEQALGKDASSVIPELVRLSELRAAIPRYQVVMLSKLAARKNVSVDEFLSRQLLDLAGAEHEWLNGEIGGFAAAVQWPEAG
jgi:hypothetical protein